MSPGTRWVTSTLAGCAVARRRDLVADLGMQRLGGALGPVLVDEPEARPTRRRSRPMMIASMPSPTTPDTAAAASRSHSNGLRSWRARTDHALAWWERTAFGPNVSVRSLTSAAVSPSRRVPSAASAASGVVAASASIRGHDAEASIGDGTSDTPQVCGSGDGTP